MRCALSPTSILWQKLELREIREVSLSLFVVLIYSKLAGVHNDWNISNPAHRPKLAMAAPGCARRPENTVRDQTRSGSFTRIVLCAVAASGTSQLGCPDRAGDDGITLCRFDNSQRDHAGAGYDWWSSDGYLAGRRLRIDTGDLFARLFPCRLLCRL